MRMIDGDALKDALQRSQAEAFMDQNLEIAGCIEASICMIDEQPTIEAQPVRHGRWENIPGMDNTVFCSECLAASNKDLAMRYKGCPFCLARMDTEIQLDEADDVMMG